MGEQVLKLQRDLECKYYEKECRMAFLFWGEYVITKINNQVS